MNLRLVQNINYNKFEIRPVVVKFSSQIHHLSVGNVFVIFQVDA
jgi:hypothetical protein